MKALMHRVRPCLSVLISISLGSGVGFAQQAVPQSTAGHTYKLTIIEGASTTKRVKKGRVSAEAVVKITDENDIPVPGVAVTFTLPQLTGGGATFANGGLNSIVTTNASGVASSGSISTSPGSSFSVSATASVGGSALSVSVPITAAAAAAAAGLSTLAIVAIIAGSAAAAGVGIAVARLTGGGGGNAASAAAVPQGTIGTPSGFTFGH